jgi:DNA-binding XRE family transcriptional regulator
MELADKLLQLRKTQGWTQASAAKKIDIQQSYL